MPSAHPPVCRDTLTQPQGFPASELPSAPCTQTRPWSISAAQVENGLKSSTELEWKSSKGTQASPPRESRSLQSSQSLGSSDKTTSRSLPLSSQMPSCLPALLQASTWGDARALQATGRAADQKGFGKRTGRAWGKAGGSSRQDVSTARAAPCVSASFFSCALPADFHTETSSSASSSAV